MTQFMFGKLAEGLNRAPLIASSDRPRLLLLIGDTKETDALHRIPIALITRGYKGKQYYSVTAADLQDVVRNFRKKSADVVIDYDHATLGAGDGEPKPAAGWLKRIDDSPDEHGVLWGWAEYTGRASKLAAAKEYKYVSPVIEWGIRDKNTGTQQGAILTSIALTNTPLFERLPSLPLVACASDGWTFDHARLTQSKETNMGIKRVIGATVRGAAL